MRFAGRIDLALDRHEAHAQMHGGSEEYTGRLARASPAPPPAPGLNLRSASFELKIHRCKFKKAGAGSIWKRMAP
jgi:hypothetical protein